MQFQMSGCNNPPLFLTAFFEIQDGQIHLESGRIPDSAGNVEKNR